MPHELDLNGPLAQEMIKRAVENPAAAPPEDKDEGLGLLSKLIYGAGVGADAATTMYGVGNGYAEEANPMLSWAGKYAGPVGAGMSVGGTLLANKLLGKNHPKLMKALLMGLGGMHGAAAIHNVGINREGKKMKEAQSDIPAPAVTEYMNPDYFGR